MALCFKLCAVDNGIIHLIILIWVLYYINMGALQRHIESYQQCILHARENKTQLFTNCFMRFAQFS